MVSSPRAVPSADSANVIDKLRQAERVVKEIIRTGKHPKLTYVIEGHVFLCQAIECLLKALPPMSRA